LSIDPASRGHSRPNSDHRMPLRPNLVST
jgi:hypothetical protein